MVGLKIECTGMLIDNFATREESIELKINLENCDDRISLNSYPSKPRSKHEFLIYDATNVGYSGKYNLTQGQSSEIFLLACSLLDPRKYLSFYQPDRLSSTLVVENHTHNDLKNAESNSSEIVSATIYLKGEVFSHITSPFTIDVNRLFRIVDNILRYRIFDTHNRALSELNVIDAIKLYRDSLTATDPRSCYLSMYAAFEKLVNAKEERSKSDFDNFAIYFNGMKQVDITYLRELNNRLKHPLRNTTSDIQILKEFEENPRLKLKQLKRATDPTILYRICDHFL
jgi:hypothetical protein